MRYAILVAVALLAVGGCATGRQAESGGAQAMAHPDCDKEVSVQVIGGKLNMVPDPAQVCRNNKVTWTLVSFQAQKDIYEFRADSVKIDGPLGEFPDCSMRAHALNGQVQGKNKISCDDKNSVKDRFDYYIKVYYINGGEAANSDPTIVNN